MLIGLVQYLITSKHLGEAGRRPSTSGDLERDRVQKRNGSIVVIACLSILIFLAVLASNGTIQITAEGISNGLGWALLAISVAVFSWMIFGKGWSAKERSRAAAILVLFAASAIFWGAYEQAGSTLNLFGERATNRYILGYEFPAGWFQWLEPLFVLILAPMFAWLWIRLGSREPSTPAKFSVGVFFVGLGFLILVPAASGALVSPMWLFACYFLHTVGEMFLSPVGLSGMTKLAPTRAVGFVMGVWFLSVGIGNWLAGKAGSLYDSVPLPKLFGMVAGIAFIAAVILVTLIRPTKRLMSGVS
jgi:POT family proton-dependent oligopeptide transporter